METQYEMANRKIDGYVAENGKYRLIVRVDGDNEDPRTWDNVGTMTCFHSRYNLGDKHQWKEPETFLQDLAATVTELPDGDNDMEIVWDILNKHFVILPLYLYDHSGITMSTSPFSCRWDSGQVGYIYCSLDKAREEWGTPTSDWNTQANYTKNEDGTFRNLKEAATQTLENEVTTYDQYLTGNIYKFELQIKNVREEWETDDSCGGFYGDDHVASGLIDHLPKEAQELVKQLEYNS